MTKHGLDAQFQIYGRGVPPEFPISPEGWEEKAKSVLPEGAFGYVAGGAGGEETMSANREAFHRFRIRPRMFQPVEDRDLTVEVLGTASQAPFFLAPIGVLSIVHPEGEVAAAKAARSLGIPFTLSTVSSFSIEEVVEASGDGARWFQLYPGKNPDLMASLVSRAEKSGYRAIVLTADTPMLGWRERDLKNAYLPFLKSLGLANFLTDPVFRALLPQTPEDNPAGAVFRFLDLFVNPAFTWKDFRSLRSLTRLPFLVKGLTDPDDAKEAVESGADGVIVSNHGGRQVDGAVAALDALVDIREAVGPDFPLLMDSGIRRGADVLKALALGAEAVLLGRPYAYGLAAGGEGGVRQVASNLMADIDLELALSGHRCVRELDASFLSKAP